MARDLDASAAALRLKGEAAYQVLARARALERQGRSIVHLEIGQPDFKTPKAIVDAAIASLTRGDTGYAPTLGLPELREAIAGRETKRQTAAVAADQVVVVPGAKTAIFLAMAVVLEPGDEVIHPDPAFPAYENIADYLGAVRRPLPLLEEKDFSFDRAKFESLITPKTKLVILNSPSNPTGGVIPADDLEFVAQLAVKHNFYICTDEIYDELSYEEQPGSVYALAGCADRTFIVNGFSKTYAMPGWRLGYLVAPHALMGAIENLAVNVFSCTTTFSQYAAITALSDEHDIGAMRVEYKRRRDYLVSALNAIPGVTCRTPGGAFYVFPNITSFGRSSQEIADHLLDGSGVALLPGTAFGACGEGYLRLSYAAGQRELEEAVRRISKGLATL